MILDISYWNQQFFGTGLGTRSRIPDPGRTASASISRKFTGELDMKKNVELVEDKPVVEDEYIDPSNLDALDAAMQPARGVFPLTLPNGKKIRIPYKVLGFAYGLEASKGERFKENEPNDPKKTKRVYIRKINMALLDGWHVVDDIERKLEKPSVLLIKKMIPVSIITPRDWNLLNELCFPGALDQAETIQDRARAISGDAMGDEFGLEVSPTGDADSNS